MRYLLPCLFLLVSLAPARAADDPPVPVPPDEGDAKTKAFLTVDPGHHVGPINELLFTPDGRQLVSAGEDRTIQVWDVRSGERLRVFRPPIGIARGGAILAAAISPDGKTLACGAIGVLLGDGKPAVNYVYLLNLDDGRLLQLPRAGMTAHALAFSPDGNRLAASYGGGVDVYRGMNDLWGHKKPRLEPWKVLLGGGGQAQLAFSPNGSRLAACTYTDETIRIWDLDRGGNAPLAERSGKLGRPEALAWSPDGKRLVTGHRADEATMPVLFVWSAEGKELRRFTTMDLDRPGVQLRGRVMRIARVFFHGDREVLLIWRNARGARTAVLFDLESGGGQLVVRADSYGYALTPATLAPDGSRAAMTDGPEGSLIALFDVRPNALTRLLQRDEPAENRLGWGTEGYTIAWRGSGQASDTWLDLKRLERLTTPPGPLHRMVHERDGWTLKMQERHLALSRGGLSVKMDTGGDITSFTLPAAGAVTWFAWTNLHGLHLGDAATGKVIRHFRPRGFPMRSVACSPDGKYLLVYSAKGMLHVYRPDQEYPLLTIFASGQDLVVWTRHGYYAATPRGETLVGWTVNNGPDQLASFYPAERFRRQLHRPEIVRQVLDKGGDEEARSAVDAKVVDIEKLLPPKATLKLLDGPTLPRVKVKASAEAAVPGQPVISLELRVDGRPLPDGKGLLKLKEGLPKAEAEWEVELTPGAHDLKVLARSPDVASASAPLAVEVHETTDDRPTLYLIAVGINTYQTPIRKLGCSIEDAKGLAGAFPKYCTGPGNLFREGKVTPLLQAEATREAILAALKQVRQVVKPGDLLVFSFAGHGVKEQKKFYLLTADTNPNKVAGTALSGDDLRDSLAGMPCQVLLLLDACHSAAGVRTFIDDAARGLTGDECGVAVLCAAMAHEEAQEKNNHGLFTQAILDLLSKTKDVPFNPRNRRQYVHHLGAYVLDYVEVESKDTQHPFLTMPYVTESFPLRQLPER
jgi:WD40 repeat protein